MEDRIANIINKAPNLKENKGGVKHFVAPFYPIRLGFSRDPTVKLYILLSHPPDCCPIAEVMQARIMEKRE